MRHDPSPATSGGRALSRPMDKAGDHAATPVARVGAFARASLALAGRRIRSDLSRPACSSDWASSFTPCALKAAFCLELGGGDLGGLDDLPHLLRLGGSSGRTGVTLGLGTLSPTQLRDRGPDLPQLGLKPLPPVVLASHRPRALKLGRKRGADLVE